jgi:short-subunit dehydrogenase
VINVASAAGLLTPPGLGAYNVSKAAVIALSETLYGEMRGSGVGVTVLCPTFFPTNIVRSGRAVDDRGRAAAERLMRASRLDAEDVARAALDAADRGELYAVPMGDGRALWRLKRLAPAAFHGVFRRAFAWLR